jgi:hypothetical protein
MTVCSHCQVEAQVTSTCCRHAETCKCNQLSVLTSAQVLCICTVSETCAFNTARMLHTIPAAAQASLYDLALHTTPQQYMAIHGIHGIIHGAAASIAQNKSRML